MGSDMTPIIPGSPSGARSPQDSAHTSGLGVEEYQWLVSPAAAHLVGHCRWYRREIARPHVLDAAQGSGGDANAFGHRASGTGRRAGIKFKRANRMFFTRQLLEQATDDQIAGYKARRWPADKRLGDLCCGIGGDLLALAERGPVVGIDRDPVAVVLSMANCQLAGLTSADVQLADACEHDVAKFVAWHVDPDRRIEESGGRRSSATCRTWTPSSGCGQGSPRSAETAPAARLPGTLAGNGGTGVDRESRRVPATNGLVPGSRPRSRPAFGHGLCGGSGRAPDHPWRCPAGDSHRGILGTLRLRAPCRCPGGRLDRRPGRAALVAGRIPGNRVPDR